MKTYTAAQFGIYARSMPDMEYTYEIQAQPGFDLLVPIRSKFVFRRVLVILNPNCVCFMGEDGSLVLERVKKIVITPKIYDTVQKITVVCGNLENENADQRFCLSARKIF